MIDKVKFRYTRWVNVIILIVSGLALGACGSVNLSNDLSSQAKVSRVEVDRQQGNPPQYSVVVSGQLPDGCTEISDVDQQVQGRTIRVTVFTARDGEAMCTQATVPFQERIELEVDGLSAGQYALEVNGVTATLNLMEDH
jgi:inhibitor of cysteine peptidase